eukprot:6319771-Amphidinium_carterae.1
MQILQCDVKHRLRDQHLALTMVATKQSHAVSACIGLVLLSTILSVASYRCLSLMEGARTNKVTEVRSDELL